MASTHTPSTTTLLNRWLAFDFLRRGIQSAVVSGVAACPCGARRAWGCRTRLQRLPVLFQLPKFRASVDSCAGTSISREGPTWSQIFLQVRVCSVMPAMIACMDLYVYIYIYYSHIHVHTCIVRMYLH